MPVSTSIAVVMGTSNDNYYGGVVSAAGSAWATAAKNAQTYITSGTSWAPWVNAFAGNDLEPAWSTATAMRNWYGGYGSVTGALRIYNFGSADGCPQSYTLTGGVYLSGQTTSPGSWISLAQEKVYSTNWGFALGYNIPQIYTNYDSSGAFSPQAVEWERLVRYGNVLYGSNMIVSGVMVQHLACVYALSHPPTCPTSLDNTATEGYDQLWNSLQYIDAGSGAQSPVWVTDIAWDQ
jgi:hypothetical protein